MALRILIVCCLFSGLAASAQKADTLRLYYALNEKDSPRNYARIDSTLKAMHGIFVDLSIYGYADFLCGPKYNADLSKARAERVKDYFLEKGGHTINVAVCEGKGESCSVDNKSPVGEPSQRKVDVIIERAVIINVSDSKLKDPNAPDSAAAKQAEQKPKDEPKAEKKEITELSVGESVSVEGLNFEPGRHVLRKESMVPLKKLLVTMQQNPGLKIEIQGHVCCISTGETDGFDFDTHTGNLSETRARAVYFYLIQKGIKADRLRYKGFGGTQPKIFPEKNEEDQQSNRRVEIKVLEK
ncbi:MAG: OmpA family protein [Bacteroidia bacterium]